MKTSAQQKQDRILKAVIHYYVDQASPVSSKTLMTDYDLPWSSATIRHVMSELEEGGFLTQPHTSAGRIPTESGFRYYVNRLMDHHDLSTPERERILKEYEAHEGEMETVLKTTSRILSDTTHYPALVLLPRPDYLVLKHVEFIRLKACQILALLIFQSGITKTRLLLTQDDFSLSDLVRVNNYLNKLVEGCTLVQVRTKIQQEMEHDRILCDRLFSKILPVSLKAFHYEEEGRDSFIVAGQELFLREPEFTNIRKIRRVLTLLEEKSAIMGLLDEVMHGTGVKIFIGDEEKGLEDLTLISAPFGSGDQVLGTLGVLGPMRMAYDRVVPFVEYTAQLLGTQLSH